MKPLSKNWFIYKKTIESPQFIIWQNQISGAPNQFKKAKAQLKVKVTTECEIY